MSSILTYMPRPQLMPALDFVPCPYIRDASTLAFVPCPRTYAYILALLTALKLVPRRWLYALPQSHCGLTALSCSVCAMF